MLSYPGQYLGNKTSHFIVALFAYLSSSKINFWILYMIKWKQVDFWLYLKLFINLIVLHRNKKVCWGYASWVECVNALSLFKFHMKCQSNGPDLRHLDAFDSFQNRIWNIVATTKKLHKNWTSNIKMIRYYVGSKYYICQGTREIPTTFFSIFNFNFSDEWSFGCNQSYTYIKRSNSS